MTKDTKKLKLSELLRMLTSVAKITYQAAPFAVIVQLVGSALTAALPIATTYFAALTTTALAEAYAGDTGAGERVFLYVGITAALGALTTGWSTVESYVVNKMRYTVEAAMTDKMYAQFHAIDFWRYDDKETADTYDKAKKFAQFFPYVFNQLAGLVTSLITFVIALGALSFVSWWLGLILIAAIIPGVIVQTQLSRMSSRHWQKHVETRRRKDWIEWNMFEPKNMAELRLYGVVKHLLKLYGAYRAKDEEQRLDFERQFMLKRFAADLIEASAEVTALVWTAMQIIAQQQPIGQFLFVQQTVSRALGSVNSLVSTVNSIDEDVANLLEYQKFMELPVAASRTKKVPVLKDKIAVNDVSFTYPGSQAQVLSSVSLSIHKGQHVAIVGENGAGKSTLIKLIMGLYEPNTGAVTVDGVRLFEATPESWHRQVAVLQQDFIEYKFATARENVSFGDVYAVDNDSKISEALEKAEAREFIDKLPGGSNSYVTKWMESDDGTQGTSLSGGQWQRLAMARNFYRDSPVVILDEPTSAIDALAEARIFQRLFKQKDKTIITISHRLTTVKKADVIFVLKNGRVVEQGVHDELVQKHGVYYELFESQL